MLSEPTNYAMSPITTLSYVADPSLSRLHGPFWSKWDERMRATSPRLEAYTGDAGRSGDPGVTHIINSLKDVTIGARLLLPDAHRAPHAVVVQLHGYETEGLNDENPWAEEQIATLQLRIRGFAGSWFETGDLKRSDHGWICHGLEDLETWALPDAVADVVCACRAVKEHFGDETPVMLMGESFGGGLAVLAAARDSRRNLIDRIAVGLPSLGAWRWRVRHAMRAGAGGASINAELTDWINLHRAQEREIVQRLSVCDAAIHARRVRIPAHFKLAQLDDAVPAPAAAAVYNALGTDAGLKHREVVSHGHFDGGIADARRHALWRRRAVEFLDPANDPAALIDAWSPDNVD